jgi:YbgC/YbaW family acyl-CoA thioester hydrolase
MFKYKEKINFFDCDPAGILFYARVYELCHSAYEAMIESFALEEDYWRNEDYIVPIISSQASYNKPIKYAEEITVEVRVSQLKNSSFELSYNCKNGKGENCVSVKTAHIFLDKKAWLKIELPGKIKESLEKHLNS